MKVTYCDLCGLPVHGKRYYIVVVHDDPSKTNYNQAPQSKEQYEIDESCYKLLVKIFDLKKSKMAEIKKFLDETYKLPMNRKRKFKSKTKSGLKLQVQIKPNPRRRRK